MRKLFSEYRVLFLAPPFPGDTASFAALIRRSWTLALSTYIEY